MTNKPFEVQDSAIVLNGVELKINESGGIDIDDNPIAGGGGDRLTNGEFEFILDNNGNTTAPGDIKTGTLGGRFIQDCDDGTTSMRWINVDEESNSTQLIRAYTGDPSNDTDIERAQIKLNWQNSDQSGLTIRSFDQDTDTEYDWNFQGDGVLALPNGGKIAEGIVTDNPTIELTPANPDIESQKLVIKGGTAFNTEANGIGLGILSNVWQVGDTVRVYVYSLANAEQTLYWWIYPEVGQGQLSDPGFGTVALDEFGSGEFTFELDSDDYSFTVRVSTVENVYDENTGVETVVLNSESGLPDSYHLHLTTGDLEDTSIFLGTDEHNVRTRISGGIDITTRDYDKSVSRRWQFNKDSELVLPEDAGGDSWASLNGALDWDNGDTEYRAVAVDPLGNIYAGGRRDGYPTITMMEADGDIVYSKAIIISAEGSINGRVNSVEYSAGEGSASLLVTLEIYPNYTQSVLLALDPATGEVISDFATAFSQENDDFYITEALENNNGIVFVGSKNGSFVDYPVVPQTGSTTGIIIINRSALPVGVVLGSGNFNYQITGTGIASPETFSNVNFYTGLTGTVREGSGATFDVVASVASTYGEVNIVSGGTNYLPGHKILIPGTSLEGISPTNDITITVNTVAEGGVITDISYQAGSYSDAQATPFTYSGVSGTNLDVGSGLEFNLNYTGAGYADGNFSSYNGGSNYVVGDIVTIPGTSLGGTSPTNDMTITVNTVDGNGAITGSGIAGVAQTTTWKIETQTAVDFTAEGEWSIRISYARENFLSTFDGNSIFFGLGNIDETDRLYAVAVEGSDIYAIGESWVNTDGGYYAAVLYKFSIDPETSAFTLGWARVLNEGSYWHQGKSVAVASSGVYATMVGYGEGTYTGLVKLDKNTGSILWQKGTISGDDSSVAVDLETGLIWVAAEGDFYEPVGDDAIKLMAFDDSGSVIDRRWLARTGDDLFFKNGRCLRISGDHVIVVGYSQASSGINIPFVFRVPKAAQEEGFTEGDFIFHSAGDYDIFDMTNEFSYTVSPQIYDDTSISINSILIDNISYESFTDARTVEEFGLVKSAIVFGDGTRLETAPVQERGIPQNNRGFSDYTLTLADNGKHIFHPGDGYYIYVPPHEQLALPIGYTVTLITKDYGDLYIEASSYYDINDFEYYASIVGVGLDQQSRYWRMPQRSIATLIKVEENLWYLSGPGIVNNS